MNQLSVAAVRATMNEQNSLYLNRRLFRIQL